MNKLFINKNIALIASEKGFKRNTLTNYFCFGKNENRSEDHLFVAGYENGATIEDLQEQYQQHAFHVVRVPTHQQIMDWLREEYKIVLCINIFSFNPIVYCISVFSISDENEKERFIGEYYDCLNKSIEYSLTLIK